MSVHTGGGVHKQGEAEAGGDLELQETAGRVRGQVPPATESVRDASRGEERVQQELDGGARRDTRAEEQAESVE